MASAADGTTHLVGDPARFLVLEELERRLMVLGLSPADTGRVACIVRRPGEGLREEMDRIDLVPGEGIPGDRWSRKPYLDPTTQIAVMQRDVAELIANGQPLTLFGDNLFLELDLSFRNLPAGSRLRVGGAILEVTATPHEPCGKFRARFGVDAVRFVSKEDLGPRRLRGVYMRAVDRGEIRKGDLVEVIHRGPVTATRSPARTW
jgi:hypothetical protein